MIFRLENIVYSFFLFTVSVNCLGQSSVEFAKLLETHKIDSIYNDYLKVKPNDKNYEEALLFRNKNGWALGKVEELKKDIPNILKLDKYSETTPYSKIVRIQRFPPSEWERFFKIASQLETYFEEKSDSYREILEIKTELEFLMGKTEQLVVDLPKLLPLLDKKSEHYSSLLRHYGQSLVQTNNEKEALEVFKNGWEETKQIAMLHSLINLYSKNNEYKLIIALEKDIELDESKYSYFELGKAYLQLSNKKKAEEKFKIFTSKLVEDEHNKSIQIKHDNIVYHIDAEELEILADFYSKDKKISCYYYKKALELLQETDENMLYLYQIRLKNAPSEEKRKELIEKKDYYQKEKIEAISRINDKMSNCK